MALQAAPGATSTDMRSSSTRAPGFSVSVNGCALTLYTERLCASRLHVSRHVPVIQ